MTEAISTQEAVEVWKGELEKSYSDGQKSLGAEDVKTCVLNICIDTQQPRTHLPENLRRLFEEADQRIKSAELGRIVPECFNLADVLQDARKSLAELQVSAG